MAVQVVVFSLGHEEYAMPIEVVQEITRLGKVRAIPQAPSFVCGLINIRGSAIPLIDLHVRFGIDPIKFPTEGSDAQKDQNTFALITEVHGNQVGFAVDQLREVRFLEDIVPPPALITAPYIGGVVNLPKRIIIQLIPEQILESSEIKGLEQLISH